MGEWKDESEQIFKRFGAKLIERRMDDDNFWTEILRTVMNPKIGKMYSQELVYAFEQNMNLADLYRTDHTEALRNLAKGNEDVMVKIKKKVGYSVTLFTWKWIEEWWQKDQPKLLGIVINHPRAPEFKLWLVEGIKGLCKKIAETL